MSKDNSFSDPSLKDVLNAVLGVKDDVNKLKTDTSNNFVELQQEIKNIKSHSSSLDQRVDAVEACQLNLTYELELFKQKQLLTNLCITGIKPQENEDLHETFAKICGCLDIECTRNDIAGIYRTRGQFNSSIIVQLKSDNTKRNILAAKKAKQSIIIDELELSSLSGTNEVNINCHLTPYFSHILYVARQAVKREELHSCWFSNKGILIRLKNDVTPILIKSAEGLAPYITHSTKPTKRKATENIENTNNPAKKVAEESANASASRAATQNNQPQTNHRSAKHTKPTASNTNTLKSQPALRITRANSTATPPPTTQLGSIS